MMQSRRSRAFFEGTRGSRTVRQGSDRDKVSWVRSVERRSGLGWRTWPLICRGTRASRAGKMSRCFLGLVALDLLDYQPDIGRGNVRGRGWQFTALSTRRCEWLERVGSDVDVDGRRCPKGTFG